MHHIYTYITHGVAHVQDLIETVAACLTACQHEEEEDAIGELRSVVMMKKRRTGLSKDKQKQGRRIKGMKFHLHNAISMLQCVNVMKKRKQDSMQGSKDDKQEREKRAGPDSHLHDAGGALQSADMMKKRRTGHNRQKARKKRRTRSSPSLCRWRAAVC